MKEPEHTNAGATTPGTDVLLLLYARGQVFAVRAEEAEATAASTEPVPLPHAPAAVLGVVCIRGRMYTLLDPPALLDAHAPPREDVSEEGAPRFVVALRGDEQLALAADRVEGPREINSGAFDASDILSAPLRATLEHEGARVHILDPSRLFDAAMQGTERRRQRT
ncbi:MAG: hypothetical protein QOE46_295 [Acidobacteriota bacterium]|jgi:chemotaxis signal transduction protein|nr:hypothetical protein [Acidobacteriota bacterium]